MHHTPPCIDCRSRCAWLELKCPCCVLEKTDKPNVGKIPLELKTPQLGYKWTSKSLAEFMINIKVKTRKTDFKAQALLDSGAQDCFIDKAFAWSKGLKLVELPLYLCQQTQNADNTLSAKLLSHETHCMIRYQGHREWISLLVISSSDPIILRYNWFYRHNPNINWHSQTINLLRCPQECI